MAAIHLELSDLVVGSILPSWDALGAVIEDYSITKKIAFFCPRHQTRINYICRQRDEGCPFKVFVPTCAGALLNSKYSILATTHCPRPRLRLDANYATKHYRYQIGRAHV